MKTLVIPDIPDEVHDSLVLEAKHSQRSKEKHALFLIESALSGRAADTCGELADRIWAEPAPDVEVQAIDSFLAERGRRSNRP
jgi:hypothetical protein